MGRFGTTSCCGECAEGRPCAEKSFADKLGDLFSTNVPIYGLGDLGEQSKSELSGLITTVNAARVALGQVSEFLREGYNHLPDITNSAGLRAQSQKSLDQVNAYATKVYNGLPSPSEPLDATNKAKVIEAVQEAQSALTLVEDATNVKLDVVGGITSVLGSSTSFAGKLLGSALGGAAGGVAKGVGPNLGSIVMVGGLVVGGIFAYRFVEKKLRIFG